MASSTALGDFAPDPSDLCPRFIIGCCRYTTRALFKWLEQQHHDVPWPRTLVSVASGGGSPGPCLAHGRCANETVFARLVKRMDTSSGLYQMFSFLVDVVVLPRRRNDGSFRADDVAEYLEEVCTVCCDDK